MNEEECQKILSMYVHIPFCAQKCAYCDFVSYAGKQDSIQEYVEAVKKEIQYYKTKIEKNRELDSIYIGGGTPSFINSKQIEEIINTIKYHFKISKKAEITIEINPGTVTKEKLETYLAVGINRISIGLQSTNNNLLKEIGRIHTYEQFLQTYQLARKVGFQNINVDLMLALPNQTISMLEESLKTVIQLQPEHISVYSLILEEGTKLYEQYEQNQIKLPEEEQERLMYWKVKKELERNGYQHYEISNFAKPGYEAKHNLDCWAQEEYIGIGCAAHSYSKEVRYSNIDCIETYIQKVNQDKIDTIQRIEEKQTQEDKQKEYMMLGLRKMQGVYISKFKEKFIQNPIYLYQKQLDKLVKEDLLEIEADTIRLTKKGLDFANLVWEEFV